MINHRKEGEEEKFEIFIKASLTPQKKTRLERIKVMKNFYVLVRFKNWLKKDIYVFLWRVKKKEEKKINNILIII